MASVGAEMEWRSATEADLSAICAVGNVVHVALPERVEVVAEKMRLFPQGAFVLSRDAETLGYALSHPFRLGEAPKLDAFLERLPEPADALFLHDVALLPRARGSAAAARLVARLRGVAACTGLAHLALVSVYGTSRMWSRYGFSAAPCHSDLSSYGDAGALYMLSPAAAPQEHA